MSRSVLIIDDMGFMREILRRIRDTSGYFVVDEAEDGEEGYRKIQALKPEIVIVDLVMPKLNGVQLIEMTIESEYCPRFVVVTTLEEKFYSERLGALGKFPVVAKPFKREEIVRALEKVSKESERKHA